MKLCPFLGLPIPAVPFPWENRHASGRRSMRPAAGFSDAAASHFSELVSVW